ncbi:MAG: hypothetical protein ACC669_12480, partial [bacterium]
HPGRVYSGCAGSRKEERGKRKEGGGKREEERGSRKEERGKRGFLMRNGEMAYRGIGFSPSPLRGEVRRGW